jgi:hypothetical protein
MSAQTPQTDKVVITPIMGDTCTQHKWEELTKLSRTLEVSRDHYKALCEELREALGKMLHQAIEASPGLTVEQANEIDEARAALKKAQKP